MNTNLQHESNEPKQETDPLLRAQDENERRLSQTMSSVNKVIDQFAKADQKDFEKAYMSSVLALQHIADRDGIGIGVLLPAFDALRKIRDIKRADFWRLLYFQFAFNGKHEPEEETPPRPPRLLESLVSLLTPREKENELLGQLAEYYADHFEKDGENWAKVLYCKEICRSLAPVLKVALRYKVLAYVGAIIHKLTGH